MLNDFSDANACPFLARPASNESPANTSDMPSSFRNWYFAAKLLSSNAFNAVVA